MPFVIEGAARSFQWTPNADGVPIAQPTGIGGGWYVLTCPLCGTVHEIGQLASGIVAPTCITQPATYQHHRRAWLKAHPAASGMTSVYLAVEPEPQRDIVQYGSDR